MARFKIYSKDGQSVRYEGKPKYLGVYLNPSCLKFSEISSSEPIAWEVGDYVDYPRTGMRYRLYSIPQPSKEARRGSYGGAFRYSGVELYAATKELEIALFRDLVGNDNNIHFSTSPDVTTFENVHGIARRIQACMDYFYPGRWEIRVADFDADADAEIIEKISTAKDFALSGGTCLDALSKIYELWQDTGWIHSYENGKEVITIGYANKRIDANTTDSYLYGKGNGLTAIKKNQTNKDEFATRLYVYGSERNLPARYYNDKEILNAESVDIRNLMLPLDSWGKTDGLPDARKAYLENAEAVAKFGVIPKTHYFDSEDAGADIYPTIERLTIGEIRSVMQSTDEYYPTDRYADGDRADAVLNTINPTDDGVLKRDGKEYDAITYVSLQSVDKKVRVTGGLNNAPIIINHPLFSKVVDTDFSKGKVVADLSQTITIPDRGYTSVSARVEIGDSEEVGYGASHGYADFVATKSDDGQNWVIKLGRVSVDYSKTIYDTYKFPVYGFVTIDANTIGAESGEITIKFGPGSGSVGIKRVLDKTFITYLKQIGFNINTQASLGKGKTISMKTGACAGRNFVISDCFYSPTLDAWLITCKRQQDDTLGMLFPNSSYEIAEGDTFVLLDIAMPELYVSVAQNRLLAEGQKFLSRASKIQSNYEPSIDAKVMVESGRTLREGMFMEITDEDVVDNTTDYILIDTLSISEDESAIPTYKVTLRERRKVTYKGTPSATSATETKSVEDETEVQPNVDLAGYAKETYVNDKVSEVNNLLASMWSLDNDGNLVTDRNVIIKKNLTIGGDMASDGEGGQGTVTGVTSIVIDDKTYNAVDGKIDLSEAFEGLDVDVDLSDYFTKSETTGLVNTAIANLVNGAPETLDTLKEVADALAENADVVDALNAAIGNKADKATTLAGYGITDAYTQTVIDEKIGTVSKAVSDLDTKYSPVKTWYDDLASLIVREGNNVRIKTNIIIDGDQSATGEGGGGAVSGITGIAVNGQTYTDTNNDGIIDLGTISGGGGINEITYKMVIDALGYTPLSTAGGTITSASGDLFAINRTSGNPQVRFESNGSLLGYIGMTSGNAVVRFTDSTYHTLYHTGNFNPADYLPLSGGKMTGTITVGDFTAFGQTGGNFYLGTPAYPLLLRSNGTTTINGNTLIHSGNIGAQRAQRAKYLDTLNAAGSSWYDNQYVVYGQWGSDDILDWKVDNYEVRVDRAKKLQTARTIWGNSFDGTGNVSGNLSLGNGGILGGASSVNMLYYDTSNTLYLGYGMSGVGGSVICGNAIAMRYGASRSMGFLLNSSGNVTFGASDLAGTTYKAYVDGLFRAGNTTINGNTIDLNRHANQGTILNTSCVGMEIEAYASYIGFKVYDTSGTLKGTPLALSNGGNILIGTTEELRSGTKLQVSGYALSTRGWLLSGDYGMWRGSTFSGSLVETDIAYYATKHIFFSGNVGISTPNPAYKLDVNGNVGIGTQDACNLVLRRNGVNYITAANALYLVTSGSTTSLALFADGTAQFSGAVTMLSTLSVGGNIGFSKGFAYNLGTNASPASILYTTAIRCAVNGSLSLGNDNGLWAQFASSGALTVHKDTTINGNLVVAGDISA